tara:strand:- start:618 stop:3188 length:2571 start_codon:yes stop_codon:yes gene_type:complete
MSVFDASQFMFNSVSDIYNEAITSSLRFPLTSGGGYLSRTFSSNTPSNDWTFSTWLKRSKLASYQPIFASTSTGNPYYQSGIYFNGSDQTYYAHTSNRNSGGNNFNNVTSSARFRDVGSWYHLVVQRDNDGNTIVYINGNQVGSSSSSSTLRYINGTSYPHYIGNYTYQSNPGGVFTGYLAETIFVDGTLVAPTALAETVGGVWIPIKDPSVTYGTNGFRLQYLQSGTGTNSSGMGADTSGNNNHFTVHTLQPHDVMPDNPENNFATLNILHKGYASTPFSQGNLQVNGTGGAGAATYSTVASTMELTGKVYFEVYINGLTGTGRNGVGIVGENYRMDRYGSLSTVGLGGFSQSGDLAGVGTGDDDWNTAKGGNASTESSIGYTGGGSDTVADAGDVVQIAYDSATGYAWYGVINRDSSDAQAWFNSGNPAAGTGYVGILDTNIKQFAAGNVQSSSDSLIFNFGQDSSFGGATTAQGNTDSNGIGDFYGNVPSGFVASCSKNLPDTSLSPTKSQQSVNHFNTVLYTGDGSNGQNITGVGFQPDWVWIKSRSGTAFHELHDSSRGAGKRLFSNATSPESNVGTVSSFNTDGFTVSRNDSYDGTNQNGISFVGWNWKANGGTLSSFSENGNNPGGTIQTNATAGFSIITYTGTGAVGTIAHGLGVKPDWVIVKRRDGSGWSWYVQHKDVFSGRLGSIFLNGTAAGDDDDTHWNDTAPTSSVITVGTANGINQNDGTYVMYAFAPVEGFSKFSAYIGNGNTNGAFVYTGFSPAWVLIKSTSSSTNGWYIYDNKRLNFGTLVDGQLYANLNNAEDDGNRDLDFTSNGFKPRLTDTNVNGNGTTYIYMAFAETPFKFANAR